MDSFKTGFIYDPEVTKHECFWIPDFTEQPDRVIRPYKRCMELNLIERCQRIESCEASEELILQNHSQQLVDTLTQSEHMTRDQQMKLSTNYDSVYFNKETNRCARLAAGCTVRLLDAILKHEIRNGFALVRPPGHHALYNEFCGFCYLNNVAIAASHALSNGIERILIVDWDVHHGQATQYKYYDDPRVLYFSIHRYQHGEFWPHLRESDYDFIGAGPGTGFNINVPLNQTGLTDSDYLAIFHHVLMPVAYEFSPQLILVSAGFDSAFGDIKGEMKVTPMAYAHFIHKLSPLADGNICTILEGGYCLKSLSEGVAYTIKALLGDPCPDLGPLSPPSHHITETILNVIKVHSPYWSRLRHQEICSPSDVTLYPSLATMPPKEGVEFCCEKNRPDVYILCNETLPPEVEAALDSQLDEIIHSQNICLPQFRTAICCDADIETLKHVYSNLQDGSDFQELLPRLHVVENSPHASNLVQSIMEQKIQNGVYISQTQDGATHTVSSIIQHHLHHHTVDRVLHVDLCPHPDTTKYYTATTDTQKLLYLPIWVNQSDIPPPNINITCDQVGDSDYVAVLHQILLPMAYQFGPQLVVLSTKLSSKKHVPLTPTGLSHIVHSLSILAAGRLMLYVQDGECSMQESWDRNMTACSVALMTGQMQQLQLQHVNDSTLCSIRSYQQEQQQKWPCFRFQVPLPRIETVSI
ncbi:histone deacetylase 6-like [Argonauta hians]